MARLNRTTRWPGVLEGVRRRRGTARHRPQRPRRRTGRPAARGLRRNCGSSIRIWRGSPISGCRS